MIVLANYEDLEIIDQLAVATIKDMNDANIPQWTLKYPRKEHYEKDINQSALYAYKIHDKIIGAMTLLPENDPPYQTIDNWLTNHALVIHRVIVDPNHRNKNVAQKLFNFAYELCLKGNYKSIKIDTHAENYKMRQFLLKNSFKEIGYLKVIDRIAYEKILMEE